MSNKTSIAFFSPFPPAASGIADYSSRLVRALADEYELDCYSDTDVLDRRTPPESVALERAQIFPLRGTKRGYQLLVYQFGNSVFHRHYYYLSRFYPGLVDLHDVNLHHLFAHIQAAASDDTSYARMLAASWGQPGLHLGYMAKLGIYHENQNFVFPLTLPSDFQCRAIIVHNDYARQQLLAIGRKEPVFLVPPPVELPGQSDRATVLEAGRPFGCEPHSFLVCAFGEILEKKGCFEIIKAFKQLAPEHPCARLLFVGKVPAHIKQAFTDAIRGDEQCIRGTGYVDQQSYRALLERCDLGLNLRFPSVGETSQTLLEMMARAKPVIVSNCHQAAELPDDCVLKVPMDGSTTEALIKTIRRLISGHEERLEIGQRARTYIRTVHDPGTVYEHYARIIRDLCRKSGPDDLVGAQKKYENHLTDHYFHLLRTSLQRAGWTDQDRDIARNCFGLYNSPGFSIQSNQDQRVLD
ncbi:glycosyltransferase family 4 protein [bacterium]|nr:glycosyltransferase family 4 protein [bacterium]